MRGSLICHPELSEGSRFIHRLRRRDSSAEFILSEAEGLRNDSYNAVSSRQRATVSATGPVPLPPLQHLFQQSKEIIDRILTGYSMNAQLIHRAEDKSNFPAEGAKTSMTCA